MLVLYCWEHVCWERVWTRVMGAVVWLNNRIRAVTGATVALRSALPLRAGAMVCSDAVCPGEVGHEA